MTDDELAQVGRAFYKQLREIGYPLPSDEELGRAEMVCAGQATLNVMVKSFMIWRDSDDHAAA